MRFTRHGLSGVPFQFRPMTVPNRHSGTLMQVQMRTTTTMLPNGTAASEWYLHGMTMLDGHKQTINGDLCIAIDAAL